MNARTSRLTHAAPAAIVALAAAWRLPALAVGRLGDDWYQRSMMEGTYPVHRAPWNLYDFVRATTAEHGALLERGILPWWAADDLQFAAMRPLSSLTLWLDHALWGSGAVGPHAHSLAWLAAFLCAAWWWMRAILSWRASLVALGALAASASLTVPTFWLANRPSLLSGVFGLLAMGVLARRGARATVVSGGLTFASLLSGEYGFAFAASAVVYELIAGGGALVDRARALRGVLAACGVYLCVWKALGYGAWGVTGYLDPWRHPGAWLRAASERLPALLGEVVTTTPLDVTLSGPEAQRHTRVALALVGLVAGVTVARTDPSRRRVTLGLLASVVAALVPVLSAPPTDRLLIVAAPVFAAASAALLGSAWRVSPGASRAPSWAIRVALAAGVSWGIAVSLSRAWVGMRAAAWQRIEDVEFRALPGVDACRASDQDHVLLSAGSVGAVHVLPQLWQAKGCVAPRAWRVLAMPLGEAVVLRAGESELTVFARGAPLFEPAARFWRPSGLRAGETVRIGGFEAHAVDAEGAAPTRMRYVFDRSLDDPRVVLWVSTPRGYEQVRPPPLHGGRLVARPYPVPL